MRAMSPSRLSLVAAVLLGCSGAAVSPDAASVDVAAPTGRPITAAKSGKVIVAGWSGGYGNLVVIDHGGGLSTAYAHQSRIAGKVGDPVTQGGLIGYIGSTGHSTGPHLHFEFLIDGEHVDPMAAVQAIPVRGLQGAERARFTAQANEYKSRFGLLDTQMVARFE
jgi:hypothetical protein